MTYFKLIMSRVKIEEDHVQINKKEEDKLRFERESAEQKILLMENAAIKLG